jgi:hypothetical protein
VLARAVELLELEAGDVELAQRGAVTELAELGEP